MSKNKLAKFAELKEFPNVFEFDKDHKGKWHQFFGNNNPITLELACGKGDYTIGLAQLYPNRNFIGIDIKGNRIWTGAKKALNTEMKNVAFLRIHIENLEEYFEPNEIQEIWITFPDPYLKKSKARKRLTSKRFLATYKNLLPNDGRVHLKTDSDPLFQWSKESLEENKCNLLTFQEDIYQNELTEELSIQTYYEKMHLRDQRKIHYLNFRF